MSESTPDSAPGRSTGELHLGNYAGAIRQLARLAAEPSRNVYVFVRYSQDKPKRCNRPKAHLLDVRQQIFAAFELRGGQGLEAFVRERLQLLETGDGNRRRPRQRPGPSARRQAPGHGRGAAPH